MEGRKRKRVNRWFAVYMHSDGQEFIGLILYTDKYEVLDMEFDSASGIIGVRAVKVNVSIQCKTE